MERQEARELLDLRDRAQQHLHEAQEFLLEVEAQCAACQPERVVRQDDRQRRRRHLRVVKLVIIGAGIGSVARRIAIGAAVPATAAAVAVTAVTVPDVTTLQPGMMTHAPAGVHGARRHRPRRPQPQQLPPSRHRRASHTAHRTASPSPTAIAPGGPLASPSPAPGTSSPAPAPSPPGAPRRAPRCTLNVLGICVPL